MGVKNSIQRKLLELKKLSVNSHKQNNTQRERNAKMAIEIRNVKKTYQVGEVVTHALRGVDLDIKKGEFVVVLGASGGGKSTLLNVMSGLDSIDSGTITIGDEVISEMNQKQLTYFRRRNLGFIFQQYNLLPNLSLEENIQVGAYLAKNPLDVNEMVKLVGLSEHSGKYPQQLSGGQQQRISIARALVKNPEILFCDEPTGALDEKTAKQVLELLVDLNQKMQTTIVFITHNPAIAQISNKIVRMNSGNIVDIKINQTPKSVQEVEWS